MSDDDVAASTTVSPPPAPPRRGTAWLAIVFALLGAGIQAWAFVNGILAALDSGGSGARAYEILFFGGTALVLIALVMSIVGIVRRRAKGLWVVALVISLLPIAAIIGIAVASRV